MRQVQVHLLDPSLAVLQEGLDGKSFYRITGQDELTGLEFEIRLPEDWKGVM